MDEKGTYPQTLEHRITRNRPQSFFVTTGLIISGILAVSMTLFAACQGGVNPISSNTAQATKTPVQTTKTVTSAPIDTGTGTEFTIDWPAPNGTSLPYLTFYNDVKYTAGHLWVRVEADNTVRIGFTDYGQRAIGDFQTVVLPEPGTVLTRDATFGFVQGGYMEYNLSAPVSGKVIQTNEAVLANHYLINQSPYDTGWLIVVRMSNPDDLNLLLTAAEYASQCCPPCHCDN